MRAVHHQQSAPLCGPESIQRTTASWFGRFIPTIIAALFEFPGTAFWMSAAGLALVVIGLWAARHDIAQAHGLRRIVALTNLCFAVPLAVFGAEHFSLGKSMLGLVPSYMPWRLFWIYFVGVALVIASLSIATKIQVRWSGLPTRCYLAQRFFR